MDQNKNGKLNKMGEIEGPTIPSKVFLDGPCGGEGGAKLSKSHCVI